MSALNREPLRNSRIAIFFLIAYAISWTAWIALFAQHLISTVANTRGVLVPEFPHLSMTVVLLALVAFNAGFLIVGLRQFKRKALA